MGPRTDEPDVEALARREARRQLSLGRLLWLYFDPFVLLKVVTAGTHDARAEALRYNCRHRRMLLVYVRRWCAVALACFAAAMPLCAAAGADPLLVVPIVGLDLVFSAALSLAFLAAALYVLLGIEQRRTRPPPP